MKTKLLRTSFLLITTALSCVALNAHAQGLYRSVDANGKVTYSDTPPASRAVTVTPVSALTGAPLPTTLTQVNVNILPTEVRRAYAAFPVTLYTTKDCSACDTGRHYLEGRGIPYREVTVITDKDIDTFKEKFSNTSMPTITVGNKQLFGYNSADWENYLNAAEYPKTNQLPESYKNPIAQPLTPVEAVVEPATPTTAASGTNRPATPEPVRTVNDGPTTNNPSGIRF